ncbi:hypothetical protein DMJ13_23650 [halophilic archaeon]|nr:hypothetical protein DMJ13_23650 [halophilic archaeon]
MFENGPFERETKAAFQERVTEGINTTAIKVGVTVGVLVSMTSLLVPLFTHLYAGLVGGLVAAYIVGGTVRGPIHGLLSGVGAGLSLGGFAMVQGVLLGMYLEPPTMIGEFTGPIAPTFTFVTFGPLFFVFATTLFVAVDGIVGGVVGGVLKTVRNSVE